MCSMLPLISLALVVTLAIPLAAQMSDKKCTPLTADGPFDDLDDMGMKFLQSPVVLYGVAREAMPSKLFPNGQVFNVEFDVKCIYKRESQDTYIGPSLTINDVGNVPEGCFKTNVSMGEAIVYLKQGDDMAFRPIFSSNLGDQDHRFELIGICQYSPEIPDDVDASTVSKEQCDPDFEYGDECVSEEDINPLPPTTTTAPKETGGETTKKPEDKEQGDGDSTEPEQNNGEGTDGEKPTEEEEGKGEDGNGKEVPYKPAKGDDGDENGVTVTCAVSLATLLASLLSVAFL